MDRVTHHDVREEWKESDKHLRRTPFRAHREERLESHVHLVRLVRSERVEIMVETCRVIVSQMQHYDSEVRNGSPARPMASKVILLMPSAMFVRRALEPDLDISFIQ